jgi:ubiquinone/menaquinone biosynthesis C-methylase UbiE
LKPQETAKRYDAIASWWDAQQDTMSGGVHYLERAIKLCAKRHKALDVGCGSGGRIIDVVTTAGFEVVGVDVSEAMLELARARHPTAKFVHADVCEWEPPDRYDLIVAWDSIFHVPHSEQRQVVEKLCGALAPAGVLLFTAGGIDGEITGEMNGQNFYYSSLADEEYIKILKSCNCTCVLLDRDQYPEHHIVMLAVRHAA